MTANYAEWLRRRARAVAFIGARQTLVIGTQEACDLADLLDLNVNGLAAAAPEVRDQAQRILDRLDQVAKRGQAHVD